MSFSEGRSCRVRHQYRSRPLMEGTRTSKFLRFPCIKRGVRVSRVNPSVSMADAVSKSRRVIGWLLLPAGLDRADPSFRRKARSLRGNFSVSDEIFGAEYYLDFYPRG